MARRLFFVEGVHSGRAEITGDEAQHLTRVLRVEPGQRYELSDNERRYLGEVESARKSEVVFRIVEKLPSPAPVVNLHLLAALVKFDRFEWVLEKAAELGAATITPVIAERTEKGLDRAAEKRHERWVKILKESCQQSRRVTLPVLEQAVQFRKAIALDGGLRLLLDESPQAEPLLGVLPGERHGEDLVRMLVGPEGGWTDPERAAAIEAGWRAASLSRGVLRAETAAVAGLAVVAAAWLKA